MTNEIDRPEKGAPTAKAVLDIIQANPLGHDQRSWQGTRMTYAEGGKGVCNTTRCVAGWAAFAHGYTCSSSFDGSWSRADDDEGRIIDELAAELLGIDNYTADLLFTNTTDNEAVHALSFLARGEAIDWNTVYTKRGRGAVPSWMSA